MKRFEEFLESGKVKKQSPNKARALSLTQESQKKEKFLEVSIKSVPADDMSPNFIVDYCYDILMEMIRAKMLLDGFNAGNSHEA